jgi:DNA replication initiation complex subunit (GINS family)
MITYNDLYEALRKEKYSEQLQTLPQNFISSVSQYIQERKELSSKEDSLFSDAIIKTKKQYENSLFLFRELIRIRKKKLLNLAFVATETGISKRDFENMLPVERELFDKIILNMEKSDKEVSSILNGNMETESKNELVVFKEDVDEFMGLAGDKFGPYKKGDISNIPKDVSKILVDSGKIERVEV